MTHDWLRDFVPDGHDRVPGWRCAKCSTEVTGRVRPEGDSKVVVWGEATRAHMMCDELVVMTVLAS